MEAISLKTKKRIFLINLLFIYVIYSFVLCFMIVPRIKNKNNYNIEQIVIEMNENIQQINVSEVIVKGNLELKKAIDRNDLLKTETINILDFINQDIGFYQSIEQFNVTNENIKESIEIVEAQNKYINTQNNKIKWQYKKIAKDIFKCVLVNIVIFTIATLVIFLL